MGRPGVAGAVLRDGYVAIGGERIAVIGTGQPPPVAGEVHDFSGKWVFAGSVDGHVHEGSDVGWDGLDLCRHGNEKMFNCALHRRPQHYRAIIDQVGIEVPAEAGLD